MTQVLHLLKLLKEFYVNPINFKKVSNNSKYKNEVFQSMTKLS